MQDQFVEQPRRHLARAAQPVRRAIRYSGVVTGVGVGEIVTRTICSVSSQWSRNRDFSAKIFRGLYS